MSNTKPKGVSKEIWLPKFLDVIHALRGIYFMKLSYPHLVYTLPVNYRFISGAFPVNRWMKLECDCAGPSIERPRT